MDLVSQMLYCSDQLQLHKLALSVIMKSGLGCDKGSVICCRPYLPSGIIATVFHSIDLLETEVAQGIRENGSSGRYCRQLARFLSYESV